MLEIQTKVKDFNDVRGWKRPDKLKDLLLNMNEEIGEFWNLFKFTDFEDQQKLIEENKAEAEDFIGDLGYLMLKIAYLYDIDAEKAVNATLAEYEERFPVDKVKGKQTNVRIGGIDLKRG